MSFPAPLVDIGSSTRYSNLNDEDPRRRKMSGTDLRLGFSMRWVGELAELKHLPTQWARSIENEYL